MKLLRGVQNWQKYDLLCRYIYIINKTISQLKYDQAFPHRRRVDVFGFFCKIPVCSKLKMWDLRRRASVDTVKPLTSNTPSCRTKSVAQEGVLLARGFLM